MKLTTARLRELIREALLLEIDDGDEFSRVMDIRTWKREAGPWSRSGSGLTSAEWDEIEKYAKIYDDNKWSEKGDAEAQKIYMDLVKLMID